MGSLLKDYIESSQAAQLEPDLDMLAPILEIFQQQHPRNRNRDCNRNR
ncbi:MAG: hypothetical protein R2880_15920 [Deinococcales bacterium]